MLTASVKEAVARRDESDEETQSTGQARTGQALHATATAASPRGPKILTGSSPDSALCLVFYLLTDLESPGFPHALGPRAFVECFRDAPRSLPEARLY